MKHRIEFFRRFFRYLYEALLSSLILIFFMLIFMKTDPDGLAVVWVFVLFAASYLIREWAPNYLWILLLHLIAAGLTILLPVAAAEKGICIVFVLFYLFPESVFYVKRFSHPAPVDDIPWPSVLTVLIIYLFGYMAHSRFLLSCAYIFMVIMLFCYLFLLYIEGLSRYIEQTSDVAGLPLKNIVRINSGAVALILCLLLLILLAGRMVDFSFIFRLIRDILTGLLRVVLSGLAWILRLLSGLVSFAPSAAGTPTDIQPDRLYPSVTYPAGGVFDFFINVSVVILAAVLVYQTGKRIIKRLLTTRAEHPDVVEQAERKKDITQEKLNIGRKIRKYWSYEDRIRRCYQYTIENFVPDLCLDEYQTCHDIENEIEEKQLGNVKELTEIYEEIRYGNRSADRKLLKRVNHLSGHAAVRD